MAMAANRMRSPGDSAIQCPDCAQWVPLQGQAGSFPHRRLTCPHCGFIFYATPDDRIRALEQEARDDDGDDSTIVLDQ
jgi:hypothetical protein